MPQKHDRTSVIEPRFHSDQLWLKTPGQRSAKFSQQEFWDTTCWYKKPLYRACTPDALEALVAGSDVPGPSGSCIKATSERSKLARKKRLFKSDLSQETLEHFKMSPLKNNPSPTPSPQPQRCLSQRLLMTLVPSNNGNISLMKLYWEITGTCCSRCKVKTLTRDHKFGT